MTALWRLDLEFLPFHLLRDDDASGTSTFVLGLISGSTALGDVDKPTEVVDRWSF